MSIYANEARFLGRDDSETIQNAVDYAEQNGLGQVTIPRFTADGRNVWSIARCILLPSDMAVFLEGCHLRMADGVRENMFRNKNAGSELGNTPEGEQHDIRLIGVGNAVIDGGEPNGLCEQLRRDHPELYPSMYVNLAVFFHNVRDFEVRGIRFIECRYWAVCFMYCRWGRISELDFRMRGNLENQDGVDLRVGCSFITVENITGITGDDTVALTALHGKTERALAVKGKAPNIHDVTVQNIKSSTHGCGIVRLLNAQGSRLYNITLRDIKDTGATVSGASVLIGTTDPYLLKDRPSALGDFENIIIRDVTTNSQRGIDIAGACRNLLIENLTGLQRCRIGVHFRKNFYGENVQIRNFTYRGAPEWADSVFCCEAEDGHAMDGVTVERVSAVPARYVFRGKEFPVKDMTCGEPTEAYCTQELPSLPSAYGRYHYMAYGKVIANRPKDNRFDGTLEREEL